MLGGEGARELIEGCRVTPYAVAIRIDNCGKETAARVMSVVRNNWLRSTSLGSASLFYGPRV